MGQLGVIVGPLAGVMKAGRTEMKEVRGLTHRPELELETIKIFL